MIRNQTTPEHEQLRYDVRRAFAAIAAIEMSRGSKVSLQELCNMRILPKGAWGLLGAQSVSAPKLCWRRRSSKGGQGRPWGHTHRLVEGTWRTRCGLPVPSMQDFEIILDSPRGEPCATCERIEPVSEDDVDQDQNQNETGVEQAMCAAGGGDDR